MNCEQFQSLINAWHDGELPVEDADRLESHLLNCRTCQTLADEVKQDEAALTAAFLPFREAAVGVADATLASLPKALPSVAASNGKYWLKGLQHLAALAAGFLLAVLVFQPWSRSVVAIKKNDKSVEPGTQQKKNDTQVGSSAGSQQRVADLVRATGDLEVQVGKQAWKRHDSATPVSFPAGTKIRTMPKTQCELRTTDGSLVRLDGNTELTMQTKDNVELSQGRLWCRVPPAAPLRVSGQHAVATCKSGELGVDSDNKEAVFTSGGEIDVNLKGEARKLRKGESLVVANHRPGALDNKDIILATTWMIPLLLEQGRDNEEINARVQRLMARLGHAKIVSMYEREIRSLGEHCVLPLIRYVQSPISAKQPRKRLAAMRILCDLAPSWSVGELIALLPDKNPEVRVMAAAALKRLTGVTQNRQPGQWRSDWGACSSTHKAWLSWWMANQSRFQGPPLKHKMKKS